jgi:hypothetical protein
MRRTGFLGCGQARPGTVVARHIGTRIVTSHAGRALADVGRREAGQQLIGIASLRIVRRAPTGTAGVAVDTHPGIGTVFAAGGAGIMRVVAGRAGLRHNRVGVPGYVYGLGRIEVQLAPGDEAVTRMATSAVAVDAPLAGKLVVRMVAELPLLEAAVTGGFAVAGAADIRRQTHARGSRLILVCLGVILRAVAVLALYIGQARRVRLIGQHLDPQR